MKNRIKRGDYERVLITETLPFETPIIFANDGLYDRIKALDSADPIEEFLLKNFVIGNGALKTPSSTVPYVYKVRKNYKEFRRLALLHPHSQWKIRVFYERYEQIILHCCAVSPASIRAPRRIAGSFYSKSSWENINQYKTGAVATTSLEKYVKHTPSFFSYHGHDRLYKFFNSRDYLSLEKRFSVLVTLDVSKCFDSIYTHSLSWAVKDKSFTKQHLGIAATFGQEFDQVIRHGNHNETNGIPIGPEVSRVFAEILFQEVDRQVVQALADLEFDFDYAFRRYVDDVFIFARDEPTGNRIYSVYSDVLANFNLHANAGKSSTTLRPFLTEKGRLIFEAGKGANEFFEKIFDAETVGALTPRQIFSRWKLTKRYIDSVKALCVAGSASYDEVASFLIAVFNERVKRFVNTDLTHTEDAARERYVDVAEVLLDILFFLYSVSPSVSASYKLSTSLILLTRFARRHLKAHQETIFQRIFDLTSSLLHDQCEAPVSTEIDRFVHLECLNVVLATRELGPNYLLPGALIEKLFFRGGLTYFTIVSCLFYVRDSSQHVKIRSRLVASAKAVLADLSDIASNSEKLHLLLDLLCCPFVPAPQKTLWLERLYKSMKLAVPTPIEVQTFVNASAQRYFLVNWSDQVDLLNSLGNV